MGVSFFFGKVFNFKKSFIFIVPLWICPSQTLNVLMDIYTHYDKLLRKIIRPKFFLYCWKIFSNIFCCHNKKQQICWQLKLWEVVAFCHSNKIFSTSCWCACKKFLARAHSNILRLISEKNFSRTHQHDLEKILVKKFCCCAKMQQLLIFNCQQKTSHK